MSVQTFESRWGTSPTGSRQAKDLVFSSWTVTAISALASMMRPESASPQTCCHASSHSKFTLNGYAHSTGPLS